MKPGSNVVVVVVVDGSRGGGGVGIMAAASLRSNEKEVVPVNDVMC